MIQNYINNFKIVKPFDWISSCYMHCQFKQIILKSKILYHFSTSLCTEYLYISLSLSLSLSFFLLSQSIHLKKINQLSFQITTLNRCVWVMENLRKTKLQKIIPLIFLGFYFGLAQLYCKCLWCWEVVDHILKWRWDIAYYFNEL